MEELKTSELIDMFVEINDELFKRGIVPAKILSNRIKQVRLNKAKEANQPQSVSP